jgi:phosphoglycerate dehydrogenase-like enzyme
VASNTNRAGDVSLAKYPRVILAGLAFPAVREYLEQALPGIEVEAVPLDHLAQHGSRAEVVIPMMSSISGNLMDRIENLRLIQQWGAGLEAIDIEAATARNVAVANVPSAGTGNAESVAEWCIMAAIALSRRLAETQHGIRTAAPWGWPCGRALLGRTAGIVGLGGIGQALAVRLKPFGMRLLGLKRRPDFALCERLGLEWIGGPNQLSELALQSDYLFLCVRLTDQTRGFIDDTVLASMPSGACVINASRGGVINQPALLRELSRGRLTGAALDVYEQEPVDCSSPLLQRADILATPHIAGVTDVSYRGIGQRVAENIGHLMAHEPIESCVNWKAISNRPIRLKTRQGF